MRRACMTGGYSCPSCPEWFIQGRQNNLCAMHSYTVNVMLRCMAPLQACFEFKGAAAAGHMANPLCVVAALTAVLVT